jgi:hypothetical protein
MILRRLGSVANAIAASLAVVTVLASLTLVAGLAGPLSQPNDGSPFPLWDLVAAAALWVSFIIGPAALVALVLYMREASRRSIVRWSSVAALLSTAFFFYLTLS